MTHRKPKQQVPSNGTGAEVTVNIDEICRLAKMFEDSSATISYALPGLKAALAKATDAAGKQDPGEAFLNGVPNTAVAGKPQTGFIELSAKLVAGLVMLAEVLDDVANDPTTGLWRQANLYQEVETANAEAFGASPPPMPKALADKLASGWQPDLADMLNSGIKTHTA
jgi:hypothetical protein